MDSPKHIEDHPFGFASKIIFNNFIKITKVLSGHLPTCMPFKNTKNLEARLISLVRHFQELSKSIGFTSFGVIFLKLCSF